MTSTKEKYPGTGLRVMPIRQHYLHEPGNTLPIIKMRLLWIASTHAAGDADSLCSDACVTLKIACTIEAGLVELRRGPVDVVLLGCLGSGVSLDRAIELTRKTDATVPIVIHRPGLPVDEVVRLTKLGAFSFICEASAATEQSRTVLSAAAQLRGSMQTPSGGDHAGKEPWRDSLIGTSRRMEKVVEIIRLVAPRRSTVLITGETGTGKEVVARAIHMESNRRHHPMVAVNCGAIPATLIEAELFGHVKGAFTGAATSRMGFFEQANGGTIFLDEVAELPFEVQAKLLRVLQEREIQRLGSSETVRVDVRVIAAANVDLEKAVAERRFRGDLFYRLNVVPLPLPSLRERAGDVPVLIRHFLAKCCREEVLPLKQLTDETLQELSEYHWPGNVRQLQHAVEMAVVLSGIREVLYSSDFRLPARRNSTVVSSFDLPEGGLDFDDVVGRIERSLLTQALDRCSGNRGKAADLLGLKRTTFLAKLKSCQPGAGSVEVSGGRYRDDAPLPQAGCDYAFAGSASTN
jgi:DNA-binding NtrC family response regulator